MDPGGSQFSPDLRLSLIAQSLLRAGGLRPPGLDSWGIHGHHRTDRAWIPALRVQGPLPYTLDDRRSRYPALAGRRGFNVGNVDELVSTGDDDNATDHAGDDRTIRAGTDDHQRS